MYTYCMAYSYDLRSKALNYIEKGGSQVDASRIFGVTVQTLINWAKRKKCGNLAPNTTKKRPPQKLETEKLKAYIQKYPDKYLREIADQFGVTIAAVFYACKRLKITLKKRHPSTKKEMNSNGKNFERN